MSRIKIELKDYSYTCGDGCCDMYGTVTTVNGERLECENSDTATIIQIILEYLGHEVEVIETEEYE